MFKIISENYLTRGFWGDEAWTMGISRLPLQEIITITGQDFHPPLYYFLVHALGNLVGWGKEAPIRLLSTFFFALIPFIVYQLTKLWNNTKAAKNSARKDALLAAILVSTAPILFTYAFEARSYALLAFGSVLSAYIFWRAKEEKRGQYLFRLLYFLLGSTMVYTHYYAWFILASHAVYLLLFEIKKLLPMLLPAFGILLAQLPWLPTLFQQTSSVKSSYWIGPINERTHYEFFLRITGGDLTTPMQKYLAILIGGLILVGLLRAAISRQLSLPQKFLLTWTLVPTLLPTLISFILMPIFFYRYLIFSAIPLLILAVDSLRKLPKRLSFLAILAILTLQISVDYQIFRQYPRSMREVVAELYQNQTPTLPIYTVLPAFAEVAYYLPAPYLVSPEGLVHFSGKSLLDAYVRLGLTQIQTPPIDTPYYLLTPEKTIELKNSK